MKGIEFLQNFIKQESFQQNMGYLENLFNAKENRQNTVTTTAGQKTKVMSSEDLRNNSSSVMKQGDTLSQNNEAGNKTDNKANNFKQRIDNQTEAIVVSRNNKIQNGSLKNKINITKLSLKRNGDDGLINEVKNPFRHLENIMSYPKRLRDRMKIHNRD